MLMAAPLATGTIVKADPENRLKEAVMNGFSDVMMNSLPSARLRKNFPGALSFTGLVSGYSYR